jgi:tetratricopeptide (TPR) repeat protein
MRYSSNCCIETSLIGLILVFMPLVVVGQSWDVLTAKADSCEEKGQVESAYYFQKLALRQAEREVGSIHSKYGETLNQIGIILSLKGRGKVAEDTLLLAQQVFLQLRPDVDSLLGVNYEALALHQRRNGQLNKAEQTYLTVLRHWAALSGKASVRYATTLQGLANVYQLQGKYEKAVPLLEEAIANRRQVNDRNSRIYFSIRSSLAGLYNSMDELEKAEPLLLEGLIANRKRSPDHPSTATAATNLAVFYEKVGDFTKAFALHKEALVILQKHIPKSADFAGTLQNIAVCLAHINEKQQADSLFKRALAVYEQSIGRQSLSYANTLQNRALLHHEMGQPTEALTMMREAETLLVTLKLDQTLVYAKLLNNMASIQQTLGNYARADSLLQEGLWLNDRLAGTKSINHAGYVANRAIGWYATRELKRAIVAMGEATELANERLLSDFLLLSSLQKEAYLARWGFNHPVYYSMSTQLPGYAENTGNSYKQ